MEILSASNLKQRLWETLNKLKDDGANINEAVATTGLAREIIRCVNTQLKISTLSSRAIPVDILEFNEK